MLALNSVAADAMPTNDIAATSTVPKSHLCIIFILTPSVGINRVRGCVYIFPVSKRDFNRIEILL